MKKYLALLLAGMLLLSLAAGCSLTDTAVDPTPEPGAQEPVPSTDGDGDNDASPDDEPDLDLVVAEVGGETVTLGEVKELYDSIIEMYTMYGYDITGDAEMLEMVLDDVTNNLVETELLNAKAKELGFAEFDAAQQAELDGRIETMIAEMEEYYRSQAEAEAANDPGVDVEARVREMIVEEAMYNLGDENATYEDYIAYIEETQTESYMHELLQDDQLKDVSLTAERVETEYNELIAEQMTYYTESPEAYKFDQEYFEMYGESPVTFVPPGYSRVLHIFAAFEEPLPDEYEANEADMELIREEYGALALAEALGNAKEGDAAEMEELVNQYKTLSDANAGMYEAHVSAAREKADSLYAELQAGADFAALAKAESSPDAYSDYPIFYEKGILIAPEYACDDDWSDEVKAQFAELAVGEYSEAFADEDGYHIIYYLADEAEGDVPLSSVEEGIRAYLLEEIRGEEWTAIVDAWMNDGTVTLHEEVYTMLLDY